MTESAVPSLAPAHAAQFESVPCAVCGADEFEVVVPGRRDPTHAIDLATVFRSSGDEPLQDQMVRCTACDLHYVRPRLRWELILEGYRGGTDENFVSQASFRERTFERCLDKIESLAANSAWVPGASRPSGKRVLDVGAAGGSFLRVARARGYEALGCEPSRWMCTFAKENYALDLHPGTLFDMDVKPGSIDLLTLFDVIEHTPDPKAVLQRAYDLLAPGGVLAMSYPDYGSLAARFLGSRWPFLLTVHLYYFTPKTIALLVRRVAFVPAGFKMHLQTLEMGYVALRAAPYLGPLGGVLTGTVKALGLARLPFNYWVGQTMIVARKA